MCRTQLPVWQEFYQSHPARTFELLAVAMDAQGPDRVRSFALEAQATYPVLIDRESMLATLFGFKAIPNGFIVDEAGVLQYRRLKTFTIKDPEVREEVERVLSQTFHGVPAAAPPPPGSDEAAHLFAEGVTYYRAGETSEAIAKWRRAWQIDPQNFIIRKQIWAVGHPDRFYPRIDFDWQKERMTRGE